MRQTTRTIIGRSNGDEMMVVLEDRGTAPLLTSVFGRAERRGTNAVLIFVSFQSPSMCHVPPQKEQGNGEEPHHLFLSCDHIPKRMIIERPKHTQILSLTEFFPAHIGWLR